MTAVATQSYLVTVRHSPENLNEHHIVAGVLADKCKQTSMFCAEETSTLSVSSFLVVSGSEPSSKQHNFTILLTVN